MADKSQPERLQALADFNRESLRAGGD